MSIKKNFFAPWAKGLGATRRVAMTLLVMMLTATTAWADDSGYCGTYVTYSYVESTNTLTISGTGAMYDYDDPSVLPWYSYAEQIQKVVIEKDVTSIGNYTFYCSSLGSITIPASVTSIGERAFYGAGLTSVEIPASVTSIGEYAFSSCYNLESVTFAEGSHLESIGANAFSDCDYLTSITIPASVTSIGWCAFLNCDLASITVADGNTVYDSRNGCNAIIEKSTNTLIIGCKNSTIPAGVTSIGVDAFEGCSGLTSIEIPASVTSIGDYAFHNCFSLTTVTIPASVTSIGRCAFLNCRNLATVTVYAPSCSLDEDAFYDCNKLANIYVFSNLVDTYKAAENWSSYEEKITGITGGYCGATGHETDVVWVLTGESPNCTLTISGTGAMADYASSYDQPWKNYRSSIKTVVIGNGVTSIGNYTFAYCTGLTSIEIPASVTSIGDDAFWNCSNLATVTFAEDSQLATIGISAFSTCRGLASVEIPASVTSIGNYAFSKCNGLATVSFAEGSQLEGIGECAFSGCTGLTSIEIPASMTSIGMRAFSGCTGLTSIEIPTSVTSIGEYAFDGCNKLTSITIPASVTSIGNYAFDGCNKLTSITIPASVTSIGVGAFIDCSNLTTMTVEAGNTVYDSRNGCNAIIEKSSNTLIAGCKNTTIPDGVTSIRNYAFSGCTDLTSIEIPAGVTSIGYCAFNRCTGLISIDIPASVTSIGISAFEGCSGLTSIEIPAGVKTIGGTAFRDCSNLATVTVYATSCTLGDNAFNNCNKLENIYVFSDYVEHYQAARNWISYEDIITAIEGIALADNADNSSLITAANGSILNVTLQGRTLYKDGDWNTLCLPFALSAEQIAASPLAGCTLMELDTKGTYDTDKQTGYDSESGTLYLYFKEATAIEAGKPYLVKWESGSNITDPVFYGVTVSNEDPENRKAISYDEKVTFRGNYNPVELEGGDASNLYLGAANKLYWPSADCTINAFRGYFHVDLSNGAKVREIRLSLDDNVTSIHNAEFISHNYNEGATYNLSGQKVSDDYKGIVIKNGRKYLK